MVKNCPHKNAKYYAKGMCKNCYHQKGRAKKAHACQHTDSLLYAKGLCKRCYLSTYHRSKKPLPAGMAGPGEPTF